jgi:ornithine carbamoyltransferase
MKKARPTMIIHDEMLKHRGIHHFLSLRDVPDDDLYCIVQRGVHFASADSCPAEQPLKEQVVGIYFRSTSTRTRAAFSSGALRLGASIVSFGPHDLQENTGETIQDTGRVLAGMLDVLVVRTPRPTEELRMLASQGSMAVINGMTDTEHPTQALADLTTLTKRFGRVDGLHVLYIGEGNSTAAALALSLTRFPGTTLTLRTPPGYGLGDGLLDHARQSAKAGARIEQEHHMTALPRQVDVVYTTRWQTTGTTKADENWQVTFAPFAVAQSVMELYPEAVFMHDLPAHRGQEVAASVLDGPASIAFDQARNKLYSAMAVLEWSATGRAA